MASGANAPEGRENTGNTPICSGATKTAIGAGALTVSVGTIGAIATVAIIAAGGAIVLACLCRKVNAEMIKVQEDEERLTKVAREARLVAQAADDSGSETDLTDLDAAIALSLEKKPRQTALDCYNDELLAKLLQEAAAGVGSGSNEELDEETKAAIVASLLTATAEQSGEAGSANNGIKAYESTGGGAAGGRVRDMGHTDHLDTQTQKTLAFIQNTINYLVEEKIPDTNKTIIEDCEDTLKLTEISGDNLIIIKEYLKAVKETLQIQPDNLDSILTSSHEILKAADELKMQIEITIITLQQSNEEHKKALIEILQLLIRNRINPIIERIQAIIDYLNPPEEF